MKVLQDYDNVRRMKVHEGLSIRAIHRQTGFHRQTIRKMLEHSSPPGYRLKKIRKSILDKFKPVIDQILMDDKQRRKKERHTAKRIYDRLCEEYGYSGKYTIVKDYVRAQRKRMKEVYFLLQQKPGTSQTDFGEALVRIGGKVLKAHFFVMALSYSDDMFVKAYPTEGFEALADGHRSAYEHFGGVPPKNKLDNASTVVKSTHSERGRELTDNFISLRSHYIFESEFCNVRRGNEKGVVERFVGYSRRNFFVPMPSFASWDALNAYLLDKCKKRRAEKAARKDKTIGELFEEERSSFLPLPESPFDACQMFGTSVSSLSLVRFKNNDYSVWVEYAYRDVLLKAYAFHIEIVHKDSVVAVHERSFGENEVILDPLHYVPLLQQKPGALEQARAFDGWELPECFGIFHRLLEGRLGKQGTREYIRVLQLLLEYTQDEVCSAIERAISCSAINYESVRMLLVSGREKEFRAYPLSGARLMNLPMVSVKSQRISDYSALISGGV